MRIAGVQFDVQLKRPDVNLSRMLEFAQQTADEGAQLTIFPECALAGYCFESLDEAREFAQTVPGPAIDELAAVCAARGLHLVLGMLEADGDKLYNAAILIGPDRRVAKYRKAHLPMLGVDRFVDPGDQPFAVHQAGDIKLGMNICYDVSFPEAARCLMLLGADLIVLPTNWPPGAECTAKNTINCRALENCLYYAAVNRVGTERGFPFIGQSQVCNPGGETLHLASEDQEEVFYADIDPQIARQKHLVRVPGKHEINRLTDRRPEMYELLVKPN